MAPKDKTRSAAKLFDQPLLELINQRHELVKLEALINWQTFETEWKAFFPSKTGRPATSARLIAGLLYLQHTFAYSDETLVRTWSENPYWQHFCGETHFQHQLPIDASSLTRWRKRIGEAGLERLLQETIAAALTTNIVKPKSFENVTVDSTVMEKAIAYPTDSKLLEKSRQHLVKLADKLDIPLRQNYNKVAPRIGVSVGRYAHAKQFKRMRAALKKQRTLVGRIWRDIDRKLASQDAAAKAQAAVTLAKTRRVLDQKQKDKNKIYSLHEPDVACISKGKARQPYEFGCKASFAITHKEGLIIGAQGLKGNPFDGHTLEGQIKQSEKLTGVKPKAVFVDKGYKGAKIEGVTIWRSGQKRGTTPRIRKMILRRSAIEPTIGHMKNDGKLGKNWLKGVLGDALNAVLFAAGHNFRMILKALRLFYALWVWYLF